jgi:hypothetical protein
MSHVLVRPDDHQAAVPFVYAAHREDVLAMLVSVQNIFS